MNSTRLRKIAKELKVLSMISSSRVSKKSKRKTKKGRMKKGSAEARAWGRKMQRVRNGR